jgi:hypothetical protein
MNGEPSSSRLILVGTVHRDPKGFGKLLRTLEKEAPDFVTVEISPYALDFRANRAFALRSLLRDNLKKIQEKEGKQYPHLLSQSEIQGIFLLLKVPFEWRAAEAYAEKGRAGLRAVDLSSYSKEKLGRISELIHIDNLRALLQNPQPSIDDQVEWQYKRAKTLWERESARAPLLEETQEREAYMAGEIRRLMEEDKKRKVLHVGGWEHLTGTPHGKSLFSRLADLKPRRLLLANPG